MSERVVPGAAAGPRRPSAFHRGVLDLDCAAESARIEDALRTMVGQSLRKRGVVVGVSGGIDSAVCAGLAARALGADRVRALLMPGRNSDPASTERGRELCAAFGIAFEVREIAPPLEALGCYRRRDEAIRKLFPDYRSGQRYKIAIAGDLLERDRLNYFTLVVESSDGTQERRRMPVDVYLAIVASTNMKQRIRKLIEYHEAERLNYAVVGTPNRLEYDQGFFVRGGDGLADVKPIAHLYKTQVYAIAAHIGVPESIRRQTPSTDTYSLPQTQEEFYFALPYGEMDLLLYAHVHGVPAVVAGPALGLSPEQVERAYRDIEAKRRTAVLLHQHALTVDPVLPQEAP
jgi:NAD+ synthase